MERKHGAVKRLPGARVLALSSLLLTTVAHAHFSPEDVSMLMGSSVGVNLAYYEQQAGITPHVTAEFALLMANVGVDANSRTGALTPLIGVGAGHLLKLQYGSGDEGSLWRLRGEIPFGKGLKLGRRRAFTRFTVHMDWLNDQPADYGQWRLGVGVALSPQM